MMAFRSKLFYFHEKLETVGKAKHDITQRTKVQSMYRVEVLTNEPTTMLLGNFECFLSSAD